MRTCFRSRRLRWYCSVSSPLRNMDPLHNCGVMKPKISTNLSRPPPPTNQLNAIVKKLGGHDMALRFLRDELSVSEPTRSWREEDGVIYFSVTSDGTTGEDWITRLESKGFRVGDYAKQVRRSPDFKPTSGVTTAGA